MRVSTHRYISGEWAPELQSSDATRAMVLCFGASSYVNSPEPILELANSFPNSAVIGCSSAGEIFDLEVDDESLVVAVVHFDSTPVRTASERFTAATSADAGRSVANQLAADDLHTTRK